MDIITVDKLVFDYPGKRVLHNICFRIPQKSVVALVGPNGAGKTTLMRCLAGLDVPLFGSVMVNGINVLEQPRECHRHIGYLSDFFGLYDELTVRQHLLYCGQAHALPNLDTRIDQVIHDVNLGKQASQCASELSRGLRQRLGIAMAILHSPKVLILDEPASGLDPEARHALSQLLVTMNAAGMTILSSSHILAELSEYSTHMLVIEEGHILALREVGSGEDMQACYLEILRAYRQKNAQYANA